MQPNRRCWAEIDLDVLAENFRNIKACVAPGARLLAVVKADGYGHGAYETAVCALENGASYLATASLSEALELRAFGITAPILILGYVDPDGYAEAIVNSITLTIYDEKSAKELSATAVILNRNARIHIKADTGMGRIGFQITEEAADTVARINTLPHLEIEGLFTHFALSDSFNKKYTYTQFEKYCSFVDMLEKRGVKIPIKHCSNSAAIMELPEMHLDMVRSGIISYGLYPSDEVDRTRLAITPAMRLKSRITHIKELPAGCCISYGCTYTTSNSTTRIATVAAGYADGYSRLLSNKGNAVINGVKVPLVGRVCMDQCMFDITNVPDAEVGDEVLLFGTPEDGITVDEVAQLMNTINYEAVCLITARVPRIYISKGK